MPESEVQLGVDAVNLQGAGSPAVSCLELAYVRRWLEEAPAHTWQGLASSMCKPATTPASNRADNVVTQQVACIAPCRRVASALFLPVCSADLLHLLAINLHFIPTGRGGTRKVGAEGESPQVVTAVAVEALVGPASVA